MSQQSTRAQRSKKTRNQRVSTTRRALNLKGRGGFWGDLWNNGKKYLPRAIGGAAGLLAGNPKAGWNLGAKVSKDLLGWGEYSVPWTVHMNSLVTNGNIPTVHELADAGMRVRHREFIGPIYSTTAFSNRTFGLNPGDDRLFPWLSGVAVNFQQYRLLGAVLTFKPSIPQGLASFSSMGSVIIACDMNSASVPAASQVQLENTKFCASARPADCIVAPIECSKDTGSGLNQLFIRNGDVPPNQSRQLYDHCLVQVATIGQSSDGVMLGNLYLSYDLELINPIFRGSGANDRFLHVTSEDPESKTPFGTASIHGTIPATQSGNVITIAQGLEGRYMGSLIWTGCTSSPTFDFSVAGGAAANAAFVPFYRDAAHALQPFLHAQDAGNCVYDFLIDIINPGLPVYIEANTDGTLTGGGASGFEFVLSSVPVYDEDHV